MSMKKNRRFITDQFGEHPAVKAWTTLRPDLPKPEALELIRSMNSCKSPVFKLVGSGINGSSVIAKRSDSSEAMTEISIYEQALVYLSKKTIHYYGNVKDEKESFLWFFTEDAGEHLFSFENQLHVSLATEWLADLHTSVPKLDCLPDRGVDYYHERLLSGYDEIMVGLSNPALRNVDVAILKAIIENFSLMTERWGEVHTCYDRFPKCLVHNDFEAKNLRVRQEGSRIELLVYDWADAGWGLPGIDIWKLNIHDYWAVVREHWCGMSSEDVGVLACLGRLFRQLNGIAWRAKILPHASVDSYEWLDRKMKDMQVFNMRMASAFHSIGLL